MFKNKKYFNHCHQRYKCLEELKEKKEKPKAILAVREELKTFLCVYTL